MRSRLLFVLLLGTTTFCLAANDPLKRVAKDLSKPLLKGEKVRVGLLAFPYHDGRISSGSSIVCERLTTYFVEIKGLRVVERRLVQKLLEEQKLSETGVIDPKTAQKMGQVLGVDILVTGTLIDLENGTTEVNARALKSGSGEVVSAAHSIVQRTWADTPRMVHRAGKTPPDVSTEKEIIPEEPIRVGYPVGRPARR